MSNVNAPAVVAIIPARGGSTGVPRKNVLPVGGVPLIARAVAAARAAVRVDRVVVTTDDAEIARVAAEAGADIVDRPAELAGATATSESALLHALDVLDGRGVTTGTVVFLQATSPFIDPAGIDEAVSLVVDEGFDAVFSAYETYGFLWRRAEDGAAAALNHDASVRPRRQDREPHYFETGAFYAFDAAGFRAARHRFFGRVGIVEVSERTAVEIDDPHQLGIARALATHLDPAPTAIDVDAVVTDFDGVHTDDTALIDRDGGEHVRVSRSDGMGVARLRRAGIPVLILSTETHPVVRARADKLRVEVLQAVDDKAAVITAWAHERGLPLSRIAYLGNDVNDLPAMALVGWPVAVADAQPEVRSAARAVLQRGGGQGAVRELAERVLRARP
ncbi:cytidylyltransferase domain-containing protein [Microbacterium sp.]|uniref:cytidylyltransferase domain-containing protein n=1 Tax=Microbacterium sp. TaxID=51671 RepID=UPI0039E50A31